MRINFKKLLAAGMAAGMLLSVGGCDAATMESLQNEIEDLEEKIEDLEETIESYEKAAESTPSETSETTTESKPDGKNAPIGKVGVALPTDELVRWANDGTAIKEALEQANCEVDLEYAQNDVAVQVAQIETMALGGCNTIIVAAIDSVSLSKVLEVAKENGVTVIAYDRFIRDTENVDYYVTFDKYAVGSLQAQYVVDSLDLEHNKGPFNIEFTAGDPDDFNAKMFFEGAYDVLMPHIAAGKLKVISDQCEFFVVGTTGWQTEIAKTRAENLIASYYSDGTNIDAWICSNDSTALGVTQALEAKYTGTYPIITGQDCDLTNVKNIIAGKQAMSVFRDTRTLAAQAAKMALQTFMDESVDVNDTTTWDNGMKVVPTYLCMPIYVDIDNYKDVLISSGYYKESDLT